MNREDELLVTGETTGAYETVAADMRVYIAEGRQPELPDAAEALQGQLLCLKTDTVIRRGDKLYIMEKV